MRPPGPLEFSVALRGPLRSLVRREGVLVAGAAGWGEFSPLPGADPWEAARCAAAAREAAEEGWPAPVRSRVPVNATVAAVGPEAAAGLAKRAAASGCLVVKVKVAEPGQGEADDLARLEAVRDALGPAGRVRVDANGGWGVERAVRMIRLLDRFGLEYVEQPCATARELAAVRRAVDVPVAADESVRTAADAARVAALAAADVVVLKTAPLGGVRAGLRAAEACGLPVVVSSCVETSVGLAAGVALAAALPELPYACGLGTASLLAEDVAVPPLAPVGGYIAAGRPVAPDPARVAACAPVAARRGRLVAAWRAAGEQAAHAGAGR
ncbi:o-succinylbenzoate synthase [Allonocardiopsis opalescens]|uniref:o-succinylbenzoate synthase n=1 Tax=Allonocardiopsis opalescens TaxID=1144618 RepID=A0A2T0Q4N4_9ACTN|nr:o-succinylbenzoate synthase [Allonocardiopsis opalescens]PRX98778.1 O-succinylbenzoate synthase [Allonocardiopsis opalescens]